MNSLLSNPNLSAVVKHLTTENCDFGAVLRAANAASLKIYIQSIRWGVKARRAFCIPHRMHTLDRLTCVTQRLIRND